MADYGVEVYNKDGELVFSPFTNAARMIYTVGATVTTSWNLPGLLEGIPFVGWRIGATEFPRPVSWSISGTTFTLTLPTAGLNARQLANPVSCVIGVM